MSDEYFYGITLSTSHPTERWDPEADEEFPRSNKLLIRQALLGPHAKSDELNVVQVETMRQQGIIKIPLAILKVGGMMHARLDVEFPNAPVTFTLVQGSGPVQLIGQHFLGALVEESEDSEEFKDFICDEEESESEDDEEESESEDDEEEEPKGKKAKISNNANGKAASSKKKAKK